MQLVLGVVCSLQDTTASLTGQKVNNINGKRGERRILCGGLLLVCAPPRLLHQLNHTTSPHPSQPIAQRKGGKPVCLFCYIYTVTVNNFPLSYFPACQCHVIDQLKQFTPFNDRHQTSLFQQQVHDVSVNVSPDTYIHTCNMNQGMSSGRVKYQGVNS
jgi:hypothetical protein